ncbi:hypothetical protein BJ875DRAFT_521654, partial [Amylocarpus encephaloides]
MGYQDRSLPRASCFSTRVFPPSRYLFLGITCLFIIATASIFTFSTTSKAWLTQHLRNLQATNLAKSSAEEMVTDCGTSRLRAEARGCIFDPMAAGWVPPICHSPTAAHDALYNPLTTSSLGVNDEFPWFIDANFTSKIAPSELGLLEAEEAYATQGYHIAHCLYMLKLGVIALNKVARGEKDVYVHYRAVDEHHMMHCTKVISSREIPMGAVIGVFFKAGHCVKLD